MKKFLLGMVLFFAITTANAGTDKGKWTGYISDSKCGAEGAKADHEACAKKCIKGGATAVFVVDNKVYTISDPKKVKEFIGKKVVVTGEIKGDKLEVETISKAPAA